MLLCLSRIEFLRQKTGLFLIQYADNRDADSHYVDICDADIYLQVSMM